MSKQSGFTLVELVVVIVILGILAATALPRFVNLSSDARIAAVNGAAGGLRGAVAVSQARYFALTTPASPISMADGSTVAVGTTGAAQGVPTAATTGIGSAMRCESATACQGLTIDLSTSPTTWRPAGGGATCQATYDAATGTVATVISGC